VVKSLFNSATSIADLLQMGTRCLEATSTSARLDSEVLLGHVLGVERTGLLARLRDGCGEQQRESFAALVERRVAGEPVAYLVGTREFYGLSFVVSPAVLVPRPETELVVEQAVAFLKDRPAARLLDLGTGSGCIAISVACELTSRAVRDVIIDAVDISADALQVAGDNAKRLGVSELVQCIQSDWCSNRESLASQYDCIVANPPYIDPDERVPRELSFEPRQALFAPQGGMADVQRILREALTLLKPGGVMLVEVGAGKRALLADVVRPYLSDYQVSYLGDSSELDRFCVLKLVSKAR
jgi:release factor glutamine methyltransferase